jgi:hypothetical protein
MLGHASAAMTLDRYGHLFGDELDAVASRPDTARSSALRTLCGQPDGAAPPIPIHRAPDLDF